MGNPKASIVITAHNYAEYLPLSLDSALNQTFTDYEIVVVDDGSTDETPEILREYEFEYPDKIRTIRLDGQGLPAASNAGIEAAQGEYIVRLDADDLFDENILTVEVNYLESHPDIDLVYPDYYTIDRDGDIIDHVRLPQIGEEVKLLNRSPLAAGAMYRKSAWEEIGGYDEGLDYQEDYDFWIRFVNEFTVHNVDLPLMYYRQHDENMSRNLSGRLEARYNVKRKFVEENLAVETEDQEVLCVIPARAEQRVESPEAYEKPLSLWPIDGRPLIEYTIMEAIEADRIDRVLVSTESEEIAETAMDTGAEVPFRRPTDLSTDDTPLQDVLLDLLSELERTEEYRPDVVLVAQYVSPLTTADHIDEAIDTHNIFSVDSVISVTENRKFLWQPGKYGLSPLFDERLLREERESLYQENGALYVLTPTVLEDKGELIGNHVGHVLMERQNAVHIDSWLDFTICDTVLENGTGLRPAYRSDALGGGS